MRVFIHSDAYRFLSANGGEPMTNLLVSLNAVLVVFSMILLGYLGRRLLKIPKETVSQFNRLVFYTMLPLMLFSNIYSADFEHMLRPVHGAFIIGSILLTVVISWIVVSAIEKEPSKRGVMIQAAFRSNYIILGIPLMRQLFPGDDLVIVSALVAIVAPMFNVLSILVFELTRGGKIETKRFLLNVIKSPLIIGTLLGFLIRALGLHLPYFLEQCVGQVGDATAAVMLIILGAQFELKLLKDQKKQMAFIVVARLFAIPAIVFALSLLFGFRGIEFAILIPVFASPIAVGSFNVAAELGGDADLAANAVAMTTLLSVFSLFAWIFFFKSMGFF